MTNNTETQTQTESVYTLHFIELKWAGHLFMYVIIEYWNISILVQFSSTHTIHKASNVDIFVA